MRCDNPRRDAEPPPTPAGALAQVLRVALLDGGSFVLPYDCQLARALADEGIGVDFHGSRTRYNGELLDAMRALPSATVRAAPISGSVAPRWRGVLAYAALLSGLWLQRRRYVAINLQFSAFWPLELPFLFAIRRRFVFTVHNAVPHGFAGLRHRPTARIAALARTLVFVSPFVRDDFLRRYGERFRARSRLLPHGLLPVVPGMAPVRYRPPDGSDAPDALVYWSTVKPYKGVELFAALARSPAVRDSGLALRIHGAWAAELRGLRDELAGLGVEIEDGYLDTPRLLAVMGRPSVFLLPHRAASQSGALYALLAHGRYFICADVGDLGAFMRRFGLERLLLKERSAAAVLDCLGWLRTHGEAVARAFQAAQDALGWRLAAADLRAAYLDPPPSVEGGGADATIAAPPARAARHGQAAPTDPARPSCD